MSALTSYLEKFGLVSLEKQEKLANLVGEDIADVDLDAGFIRFAADLEFEFQVLGTESDNTLTWLWAWAEEQTEVPSYLLNSALQMKSWGESEGISECTIPSVDLIKADGHILSIIASAMCKTSCYYHDDYQGGSLFLLLFGKIIDAQPSFDITGFSRQFSHLISLYEFNHKNAFRSYFEQKDIPVTEHGVFMVSELESGEDIRAEFDSQGKLKTINGMPIA